MAQTHFSGLTAAVLVAGSVLLAGQAQATTTTAEALYREGAELSDAVADVSADIRRHARHLERLSEQIPASRETHAAHLDAIRDLVNGPLRKRLAQLEEVRPFLPEWKQESIDRMLNSARYLAANATAAYSLKWADPRMPVAMSDSYRAYIRRMVEDVARLTEASETSTARIRFQLETAHWDPATRPAGR